MNFERKVIGELLMRLLIEMSNRRKQMDVVWSDIWVDYFEISEVNRKEKIS